MNEIWKDIEGYEGLYQISSLGKVKSLNYRHTGKEKILKLCKDKDGYLQVCLCKDGKVKCCRIHRLVASAFLPNPDNLSEINHIDENKQSNCLDNLEYCDRSYNTNFGTRNERVAKALSIPILQFTKKGEFIRRWDSTMDVKRELGFCHSDISRCCKGKLKTCGGYVWGYADDYEKIQFKVFDLEMYEKKKAA